MSEWYKHIDHTGDIGIVVKGGSITELFEHAARAMFEVIADLKDVQPKDEEQVQVEAEDLEALLVRWLSELNFRHITQEKLFCRFSIQKMHDRFLSATIWGEPVDPAKHTIYTEIKAVTFHGLYIKQLDEWFEAQIIFDM